MWGVSARIRWYRSEKTIVARREQSTNKAGPPKMTEQGWTANGIVATIPTIRDHRRSRISPRPSRTKGTLTAATATIGSRDEENSGRFLFTALEAAKTTHKTPVASPEATWNNPIALTALS